MRYIIVVVLVIVCIGTIGDISLVYTILCYASLCNNIFLLLTRTVVVYFRSRCIRTHTVRAIKKKKKYENKGNKNISYR